MVEDAPDGAPSEAAGDGALSRALVAQAIDACREVEDGARIERTTLRRSWGALVAASIVAISSIHLLKAFMNASNIPNDKLMWYVIIHITFVLSAMGMVFMDRLNRH